MKKLLPFVFASFLLGVGCNKYKNHIDNGVYEISYIENKFESKPVDAQTDPYATGPMGRVVTVYGDSLNVCSYPGTPCSRVEYSIAGQKVHLPNWELDLIAADEGGFTVGYQDGKYTYTKQ